MASLRNLARAAYDAYTSLGYSMLRSNGQHEASLASPALSESAQMPRHLSIGGEPAHDLQRFLVASDTFSEPAHDLQRFLIASDTFGGTSQWPLDLNHS
jgi:hypothetical protein